MYYLKLIYMKPTLSTNTIIVTARLITESNMCTSFIPVTHSDFLVILVDAEQRRQEEEMVKNSNTLLYFFSITYFFTSADGPEFPMLYSPEDGVLVEIPAYNKKVRKRQGILTIGNALEETRAQKQC